MSIIDYAFFVGLIVTIVIHFFTSSGGFISKSVTYSVQSQSGMKMTEQKDSALLVTRKSFSFLISLVFTLVSLLATTAYYWKEL
ncbi:hypothetical protein [Gottfriedia acidiceleris]|uniref:hypothetical protein n=1 Tax=Gottfriedia acidiceleris TaxID=371036 RepID=UPI002FFF2776